MGTGLWAQWLALRAQLLCGTRDLEQGMNLCALHQQVILNRWTGRGVSYLYLLKIETVSVQSLWQDELIYVKCTEIFTGNAPESKHHSRKT